VDDSLTVHLTRREAVMLDNSTHESQQWRTVDLVQVLELFCRRPPPVPFADFRRVGDAATSAELVYEEPVGGVRISPLRRMAGSPRRFDDWSAGDGGRESVR
jgi:hypothetical protein